jgi:hypothetical protein
MQLKFNIETAYLLGLLWGDGHCRKKYGYLVLNMIESDFTEIEPLFGKFLLSPKSWAIRRRNLKQVGRNNKPQGFAGLYDGELGQKLLGLGMGEKSSIAPKLLLGWIPVKWHFAFWRGYFDADGSIYVKGSACCWQISSSYEQEWDSVLALFHNLGINGYRVIRRTQKSGKSSYISIRNRTEIKLLSDYLYQSSPAVGFARKRDKLINLPAIEKTSKRRGVCLKPDGKWTAYIRRQNLGVFNTEGEAIEARLRAETEPVREASYSS